MRRKLLGKADFQDFICAICGSDLLTKSPGHPARTGWYPVRRFGRFANRPHGCIAHGIVLYDGVSERIEIYWEPYG